MKVFQSADPASPFERSSTGPVPGRTHELESIFVSHPDLPGGPGLKADSAWSSAFDYPEPVPKKTPEQLADMERFRAIMDGPTPDKPAAGGLFGPPAPAPVDPNMQALPTSFNPVGQSVAPLQRNIGLPTGLTPLPGVTGPLPTPKKPTPLVQPPPWMQSSLQNSTMPQRQF